MKFLKWTGITLVILLAAVLLMKKQIMLHAPGIINKLKYPVAEHKEIQWTQPPADLAVTSADQRQPNIILIIADDLGWNDISLNGGGVANGALQTPNINELAHNGVNFTQGYTADGTCAPSRAAIMTGRYGSRFGFESTPVPDGMSTVMDALTEPTEFAPPMIFAGETDRLPFEELGMPNSEITIADMLKDAGYQTGHIGKWHLGRGEGMLPHQQGFDDALMMASGLYLPADDPSSVAAEQDSNAYNKFLWSMMDYAASFNGLDRFKPKGYITDYYTDEAVKFIETNKDRPFYLNLAHWAPHNPMQALKTDYDSLPEIKDHTQRVYAAMIKSLDRSVGRVTQALKDNGIEDNTMIIFVSDNGGTNMINVPDINKPYRGWKVTFFEGGIRTPFFVKWPAQLEKGSKVANVVHHTDIFPTIAAAAGGTVPSDRKIDGKSLIAHGKGESSGKLHDALFWKHDHYQAVLSDGWKMQVSKRPGKTWLINLNQDPGEKNNIAEANPEKVKQLTALLTTHNSQLMAPAWTSVLDVPINIDKMDKEGWAEGDEFVYYPN
jgi:arylsulfatase A-like enzyme